MKTYSWIGYVDFQDANPHIFAGRIEVFGENSGLAVNEYTVRYKQVFPNVIDFRDWIDDLQTEVVLNADAIFKLFAQQFPNVKVQRLVV